jgi:predicted secreted protein
VSVTTALAVYFIIWWVVLFAVLPFGVTSQANSGEVAPGTDPGAPALPRLLAKLAWTTVISAAVYAVLHVVYVYRLLTLDDIARLFGMP